MITAAQHTPMRFQGFVVTRMGSCSFRFMVPRFTASNVRRSEAGARFLADGTPLTIRADKTPDNPDGEDDYTEPVTGDTIPRSRILPFGENGVNQPDEAKSRKIDWDQTCTDAGDRLKITKAFADAKMLGKMAVEALGDLSKSLPEPVKKSSSVKENQQYIAIQDPAYTQMWHALDQRVADVKNKYEKILTGVEEVPDNRSKGKGGLRFICDKDGKVMDPKGKPYCDGGSQAITNNAGNEQPIEQKYVFAHSASIVFCPPFFDDTKYPNMEQNYNDFDHHKTLDLIDCRERIVLHELTHLAWTINIWRVENRGFLNSAKTAGRNGGKDPDWSSASNNADNFAWYALYSYWNRLDKWGSDTCNNDAWPEGVKKPNKVDY
ncbi:hypothetical protein B0O99DRAFT_691387 [Bisporella sp. PMI_857]|nr:hypothetical protein B0O99DRAFT_691387 [Bisporella sp. PMI_857]